MTERKLFQKFLRNGKELEQTYLDERLKKKNAVILNVCNIQFIKKKIIKQILEEMIVKFFFIFN